MEAGFSKAGTDNLPNISEAMIVCFFKENQAFLSAETKGAKIERSARDSYGDKAVGYVQVKRDGAICTVKARVTPEHKLRKKAYEVTLLCDESQGTIISVQCHGCAAQLGGCKHAIAFLFWVHRKSSLPSTTEVQCYWKKSSLSCVGTSIKFLAATKMGKKPVRRLPPKDLSVYDEFVDILKQNSVTDIIMSNALQTCPLKAGLSLHMLRKNSPSTITGPDEFLEFASQKMTDKLCQEAATATTSQSESALWHELRYGRITASKFFASSRCTTLDGSLVESILGAKFRLTSAMERGIRLENAVIQELRRKVGKQISPSGFLLHSKYPAFGASPDGVSKDFVVEVKCPSTKPTMEKYFTNGLPAERYYAQLQMQMLFAKKPRGLFCVADPDFETNKMTTEVWVDFNEGFLEDLMSKSIVFWKSAIFNRL